MAIYGKFKHLGKLLLQPDYRKRNEALKKLIKTPRYTPTNTSLLGYTIDLVDSASFLFMYQEIFERQIYKFKSKLDKPIIIDCGANIGLSVLYFKKVYPDSQIIAFEPDLKIFQKLTRNIYNLQLSNVKLVNKAVWSSETTLEFMSEGADAGRLTHIETEEERSQVQTTRLRQYLAQKVDFLKIDIEGAETEVIKDCQDLLENVENLFVEYHSFVNQPQTLETIINILSKAKFRLHIHTPMVSPQPFYHRNVCLGMDMQLNIFAFRE